MYGRLSTGGLAMSDPLRICLYDAEPMSEGSFRESFEHVKNIVVVGDTSTWDELKEWLRLSRMDLVAINLGEQREQGLAIVQRIAELAPNVSILGVSRRTDPQTIIAAMRAGCNQFVTWPVDVKDLVEAVERIRSSRVQTVQVSKRICVIGASGGAGATTLACNLGIELGQLSSRRCALVDMNLEFGDVCSSFDCSPSYTITDVCRGGVEIDRLLLGKAMHELPCHVSILGSPRKIQDAHEIIPESIPNMLKVMAGMYPFVVVDLPRMYAYMSAAALEDADYVLIVTQLGVPFIRNATRILNCLLSMGVNDKRIEVVLNRCNSAVDKITPEDVEQHFRRPIFAMVPNDYQRIKAALDLGHMLVANASSGPARAAIQVMARKIAGMEAEAGAAAGQGGGLFGKLLRRGGRVKAAT
ncbi:MAG TPA: response regulator [Phycisphaerae bacterium]|nr:response regulator [Phycisphaerae bacterium]